MATKYDTYLIDGVRYVKYVDHKALMEIEYTSNTTLQNMYDKLKNKYDDLAESFCDIQVRHVVLQDEYDALPILPDGWDEKNKLMMDEAQAAVNNVLQGEELDTSAKLSLSSNV